MAIIGFDLKAKNNIGYIKLNPVTSVNQVVGLQGGSLYGPYTLTLNAINWSNNRQTLPLSEIKATDIPMINKILNGSMEQMIAQDKSYAFLDINKGVEALNGQIRFMVTSPPPDDFQVQVWWTR